MFEESIQFLAEIQQVVAQPKTFLILLTFLVFVFLSYVSRVQYDRRWKAIESIINSHVNTQFKLSTSKPLVLTASTRRFAATNYGVSSHLRYIRLLTEAPSYSNIVMRGIEYVTNKAPKTLLEIKIEPKEQYLYAAIINKQFVSLCRDSFKETLPYFQSIKEFDIKRQKYEICVDLVEEIEIEKTDFVVFNNDQLTVQCDQNVTELVLEKAMQIAKNLAVLELSDQQQEQINKKVKIAQKQISAENARKQADESEQNSAKRMEELENQLRSGLLTKDEADKVQMKIDSYIKREEEKTGRKMREMAGLGSGKQGKQIITK